MNEPAIPKKIETIKTAILLPYARNSRTHSEAQIQQIASSIQEFGFTNPILIDEKNQIIAGHGRLAAAHLLKIKEVPCIRLSHLTETQKKAYVIADNKLALNAGWDDALLALELKDLESEDFDLSLTGFSEEELAKLLVEAVEGQTDPDDVPEVQETAITVLGDIWTLGKHRLMCGDSTSIDAVEKLMNGQKADMVFTDPPYGVDYKGIKNDSRNELEKLLRDSFSNYFINSKEGASIYCFHSDKCADIFHKIFREFFHFSSMIIWSKNSLTLSQTDYQSQHEPCLYGWMKNGSHSWYSDRKQTSIWKFDKEKFKNHTTPKPVELIKRAIQNSSKSGDMIIDLFGGSGSTMIASESSNRESRLMELDPKYCDVIIRRWQDFTGKKAIHSETGKTFDEMSNERGHNSSS